MPGVLSRLRRLFRSIHEIDPRQSIDTLIEEVCTALRNEMGGTAVSIVVRRDHGVEIGVVSPAPPRESVRFQGTWFGGDESSRGIDLIPTTLQERRGGHRQLDSIYSDLSLGAAEKLSAPLMRRGLAFGFLEVLDPGSALWRSAEGAEFFRTVVDEVGVLLDNALLLDRLKKERLENELLYTVSREISLSVDTGELMASIIDSLRSVVPYDAAAIFLLDARTLEVARETIRDYRPDMAGKVRLKVGEGVVGWAAKTGQSVIVPDVRVDPRYVSAREQTRAEMVAPLKLRGEVIGVFNLESDRLNAYSNHELRLLETFASHAAVAIERSMHLQEQIEKNRLDRELSIARRIQLSFLPERDPGWPGFDVSGYNISSEEVSGDFFDYIPISDSNWGLVIADVSGKGVPASLIMASLRAALWHEARNTYSLSTICRRVNGFLYQSLGETEFVTAVYGVLDLNESVFTYANAGHFPPILLRNDGRTEFLEEGGLILGAFPDVNYQEGRVPLLPGDTLLFYTDGAVEALDANRDEFGRDRLISALKAVSHLPARQIRTELVSVIQRFAGRSQLGDDLTFIVLKKI